MIGVDSLGPGGPGFPYLGVAVPVVLLRAWLIFRRQITAPAPLNQLKFGWFRWLWALLPLVAIGWWVNTAERARIEQDLTNRAATALGAAGQNWAKVTFNGRDAMISGTARTAQDNKTANAIIAKLPGVRSLAARTDVLPLAKPYSWSARSHDGGIKLTGHVPSKEARKSVLARVQATLPNTKIVDAMKLAAGEPELDKWNAGVSFGLRQLSKLKSGAVSLEDTALSLSGLAASPDNYAAITKALSHQLPKGLSLKSNSVRPAVARPFTFSAVEMGDKLVLSGYVPNETVRKTLLGKAQGTFAKSVVIDNLQIAAGAPKQFPTAAMAAIATLKGLQQGAAQFSGTQLNLKGQAEHQFAANQAVTVLRAALPKPFTIKKQVTWKVADPYVWSARQQADILVLTGHVPNPAVRKSILAAAAKALPGLKTRDEMSLASGKIKPAVWQKGVVFALQQLSGLPDGQVTVRNKAMTISGKPADYKAYLALQGRLKKGGPGGFSWAKVSLVAPAKPQPEIKPETKPDTAAGLGAEEAPAKAVETQ